MYRVSRSEGSVLVLTFHCDYVGSTHHLWTRGCAFSFYTQVVQPALVVIQRPTLVFFYLNDLERDLLLAMAAGMSRGNSCTETTFADLVKGEPLSGCL